MSPPQVAVVIPSWNSRDLLARCLDSLADPEAPIELMVVDNGSTDGSVELLEGRRVPHVALPDNVGFAAAMNLGVARTEAPAVLALNSDAVLEPGALGPLTAALEADRSLGGVQPRILQLGPEPGDPATARLYSAGQALTRDGRAYEVGAGEAQRPELLARREVFGVCGAACLLRRELFGELGGYEERFFAFYEDVELNVRARIAGWRFEYVPEAVVWHLGNASWQAGAPEPSAWNARLVARNRLATQLEYLAPGGLPRLLAVEAGALARAAGQRRLRATARGKWEALGWLAWIAARRRRLRSDGDLGLARRWLGDRGV